MTARRVSYASAFLIAVLLCTACVPSRGGLDESTSLDQSKARAQEVERQIVAVLPAELLTQVDQMGQGSFISCSRDGGAQWAGGLTATVSGNPAPEQIIDPIAVHFAAEDDLAVRRRQDDGDPVVDILGAHREMWIVRYIRDRGELDIDSFAACIRLPDGVWRGGTY